MSVYMSYLMKTHWEEEDDDVFVEAVWCEKEIIAYSTFGYDKKSWKLPCGWSDVTAVDLYRITLEGLVEVEKGYSVFDQHLELSLAADVAYSIVPHGKDKGLKI